MCVTKVNNVQGYGASSDIQRLGRVKDQQGERWLSAVRRFGMHVTMTVYNKGWSPGSDMQRNAKSQDY